MLTASLPWYDLPPTRRLLDQLWSEIARHLPAHDRKSIPKQLERNTPGAVLWQSTSLILGQCCGPDLHATGKQLAVIGRPVLAGLDCEDGDYYSVIVMRPGADPNRPLRAVINSPTSWSGCLSLQGWLRDAPLSVSSCIVSGAHQHSLDWLAAGRADIAAIDACSWQFLQQRGITVIDRTTAAPAPPFVCHRESSIDPGTLFNVLAERLEGGAFKRLYRSILPATRATYAAPPALLLPLPS